MTHIKYTLRKEEFCILVEGEHYLEIWQGLPELQFQKVKSRGGKNSLLHEVNRDYIWVEHSAVRALERNNQAVLVIGHKKTLDDKLNIRWIYAAETNSTFGDSLESVIIRARKINQDYLKESSDVREKMKNGLAGLSSAD